MTPPLRHSQNPLVLHEYPWRLVTLSKCGSQARRPKKNLGKKIQADFLSITTLINKNQHCRHWKQAEESCCGRCGCLCWLPAGQAVSWVRQLGLRPAARLRLQRLEQVAWSWRLPVQRDVRLQLGGPQAVLPGLRARLLPQPRLVQRRCLADRPHRWGVCLPPRNGLQRQGDEMRSSAIRSPCHLTGNHHPSYHHVLLLLLLFEEVLLWMICHCSKKYQNNYWNT